MSPGEEQPILTLEALVAAVRAGVEREGWELSGLQKTTSHQFEGRWEGDSTRSAYIFFHRPVGSDEASIDVYLDETSRGLSGNLALVVDLLDLGELGDATRVLRRLAAASMAALPEHERRPVTLRFRLPDAGAETGRAETEVRFKIRISGRTIAAGSAAVSRFAEDVTRAFAAVLGGADLQALVSGDGFPT